MGSPTALLPWGQPSGGSTSPAALRFALPVPSQSTAALPEPGVRPIIFLPGITGSFLADGTTEVWPDLAGIGSAIECSSQSVNVQQELAVMAPLALSADGTPPAGSGVGVANGVQEPLDGEFGGAITEQSYTKDCGVVLDILSDLFGASRNVNENVYAATATNAADSGYTVVQSDTSQGLNVCVGNSRCFIPVGYDWRLSAEENATAVLQIINQVLSVTGADRVDILAHSQGGLVAEEITKLPQSIGKIYRIVTLGTPFLGAPEALTELLEQTPCQDPPQCYLNAGVVQSLIENYPGVMELLPSSSYYTAYSAMSPSYSTVESEVAQGLASLSYPSSARSMSLVAAAEQMHESDDAWAPLDPTVGLLRMIGYDANDATPNCAGGSLCDPQIILAPSGGDTITSAFDPNGTMASSPVLGDGDGTVPLFSANLYNPANGFDDRGSGRDMYWCGLSHMGLAQDTAVWQIAEAYLEGDVSYATDAVGAACPGGGLGTIANLNLVGAAASEPAGAQAPGPTSNTSCSAAASAMAPVETSMTIINSSATDSIDLYWYDSSCHQELYARIPPQMQVTRNSFVGDVWHLVSQSSGSLLGTVATTTAQQQIVVAR